MKAKEMYPGPRDYCGLTNPARGHLGRMNYWTTELLICLTHTSCSIWSRLPKNLPRPMRIMSRHPTVPGCCWDNRQATPRSQPTPRSPSAREAQILERVANCPKNLVSNSFNDWSAVVCEIGWPCPISVGWIGGCHLPVNKTSQITFLINMNPIWAFTLQGSEKCILSYAQVDGNNVLVQSKMAQPLTSLGKCLVTLWYKRSLEWEHFWCVVDRNAHDSII